MTDTEMLSAEALDAEDYLLDSMGDAITLWEALRHPASIARFAHFETMRQADPWAARESVAQLVEFFQHATDTLDAPSETLAELFLIHCTNAADRLAAKDSEAGDDADAFLECLIAYDLLPKAGEHLAALDLADDADKAELEASLKSLRNRRDA